MSRFATAGLTALMVTTPSLTPYSFVPAFAQEAVVQDEQESKASLVEMTGQTERLIAAIIRASRLSQDAALDIQAETGKPYWTALRSLNSAVEKMANGAVLRDKSFHEGLSETVREGSALIASYELSGAKDPKVEKVTKSLEENVTVLYDAFSKAANRAKSGGELTQAELKRLKQIKAKQVELQRRLDAIEGKIRNNKRALAELEEARRRSREISRYGPTAGDFLAAMISIRILDGLIWGSYPWWGPWGSWYPDYSIVIIDIYDDYYDAVPYDWDYYGDVEIDYDLPWIGDEEIAMDEAEMNESFDYLDTSDADFNGDLSDEALVGLEDPTESDLANEDFGFDEAAALEGIESGTEIETGDLPEGEVVKGLADGLGSLES